MTNKKHYRLYVINKLPQLRVLDFQKVKLKVSGQKAGPVPAGPVIGSDSVVLFQERQEADKMFKGKRGAQLAKDISRRMKTYVRLMK